MKKSWKQQTEMTHYLQGNNWEKQILIWNPDRQRKQHVFQVLKKIKSPNRKKSTVTSMTRENNLWNEGEMKLFSQRRTQRVAASRPSTMKRPKFPERNWRQKLRAPERKVHWSGETRESVPQTSPLLMSLTYTWWWNKKWNIPWYDGSMYLQEIFKTTVFEK